MIGQTISHYRILEKLGEGGMGVVYKAEDTKLHRPVALKVLPREALITEEDKTRFAREAQAAASLSHPNVAIIHEFDEVDDPVMGGKISFIAMEYVEGKTLKDKIQEHPLPLNDVVNIGIAAAEGLQEAHEKGIVHRDIKSANIMVTSKGQVKIMDFGLAEIAGRSRVTKEGMTVGTTVYMSPEQAMGEKLDQQTDIWSLGVVLYEMITGRLPFSGDYEQAIVYRILNEEPEPITSLRSNVPMELERVVRKAMQKDRSERYQRVEDLLVDLRSLRKGLKSDILTERATTAVQKSKRLYLYSGLAGLLVLIVIALYVFLPSTPPSSDRKSIAVLPFKNMNRDEENEFFSEGITEDIITHLSKINDLKVISRTSIMRYKNSEKNLHDIGRELGAATILEGSVRRAGNQVRIVAQLIDASTDEHLWAETYDKEITQIFAIQTDVAQRIASALQMKLSHAEKERLARRSTENTDAYQLYLKGRYHWNKRGTAGLESARQYFEEAINIDPKYAMAYTGLADYYNLLDYYRILPGKDAFPRAKAAATKALEIDETLAEAHTSLAWAVRHYDWNWLLAESELKRAIELNPKYPVAHYWYANHLSVRGHLNEAIAVMRGAVELDPLSLPVNRSVGNMLYYARQYDQAIEQYRRTIELDSNFADVHHKLSLAYVQKGMYEEAIVEVQKAITLSGVSRRYVAALGYIYGVSGRRSEAQKVLDKFTRLPKQEHIWSYDIATIYVGLDEKDQAFEWLEKASEERSQDLLSLKVEPMFDSLRSDPRFTALLKKVGLEK